jgi:hypothetical protein
MLLGLLDVTLWPLRRLYAKMKFTFRFSMILAVQLLVGVVAFEPRNRLLVSPETAYWWV